MTGAFDRVSKQGSLWQVHHFHANDVKSELQENVATIEKWLEREENSPTRPTLSSNISASNTKVENVSETSPSLAPIEMISSTPKKRPRIYLTVEDEEEEDLNLSVTLGSLDTTTRSKRRMAVSALKDQTPEDLEYWIQEITAAARDRFAWNPNTTVEKIRGYALDLQNRSKWGKQLKMDAFSIQMRENFRKHRDVMIGKKAEKRSSQPKNQQNLKTVEQMGQKLGEIDQRLAILEEEVRPLSS
ncbi:hypothetical protein Ddc_11012 [Ditylenchus destructor]|nr:hypothetical protein Ddc_11012 [Ditylenchus destructor]